MMIVDQQQATDSHPHPPSEDDEEKTPCVVNTDRRMASETYLETSPVDNSSARQIFTVRSAGDQTSTSKADTVADDDVDDDSVNDTNDDGMTTESPTTAKVTYMSHVYEVMERMKMANKQILLKQDEKATAFRRKIDDLICSSVVAASDDANADGSVDYESDDNDEDSAGDNDSNEECCRSGLTATGGKNKKAGTGDTGTVATVASTCVLETSLGTHRSHDSIDNTSDGVSDQLQHHHLALGDVDTVFEQFDEYFSQYQQRHRSMSPSHRVVIGNLPLLDEEKPFEKASGRVQVTKATATEKPLQELSSCPKSSYTSMFDLRKEVVRMKSELVDVKAENGALHALNFSYQNRTIQEINHSRSLEQQVCLLEHKIQELLVTNHEQEQEADRSKKHSRVERMKALSQEATLQHKNERVRRDLDKLWKQYKVSQKHVTESHRQIDELQNQIKHYEQQEVKWRKERSFMKEKLEFMKTKNTKLTKMLHEVREMHSTKIVDLTAQLNHLKQTKT